MKVIFCTDVHVCTEQNKKPKIKWTFLPSIDIRIALIHISIVARGLGHRWVSMFNKHMDTHEKTVIQVYNNNQKGNRQ